MTMPPPPGLDAEYVLPLRWATSEGIEELTGYLAELAGWMDVTVVDGSPAEVFTDHHARWLRYVRHLRPQPWPGGNGKVTGCAPHGTSGWSSPTTMCT